MSISIGYLPRAIIHIDGDCFFANCEVAKNPALKGKVVVVGMERGISTAITYEGKRLGIKRGTPMHEIKRICPAAVILPSDYEAYSLYSKRMFNIVRRYTNLVEEYSIDECFAEITGLRTMLKMSYEDIARKIKLDLETELGMTFSIGLASTKVLAKVASKWEKPSGCTIIPNREIHNFLKELSAGKIWGIGAQTSALLKSYGIISALDFALRSETWIKSRLNKPYYEIWQELNARSIYQVNPELKDNYASISKTKTFTPASNNSAYVFSQLSKNVENACIKARRYKLAANEISIFLKTQDFRYRGLSIKLSRKSNLPTEIIAVVEKLFIKVFDSKLEYRATGVVLSGLSAEAHIQLDLFTEVLKAEACAEVYKNIDLLAKKYGKHTVFLGSSTTAINSRNHKNSRAKQASRVSSLFKGETKRKRLKIPYLGEAS